MIRSASTSLRSALMTAAALAALLTFLGGATADAAGAPGSSRLVQATPADGVRLIGDLRVGPLGPGPAVSTLAEVRSAWGPELRMKPRKRAGEACVASWGTGVRLLFTTFGDLTPCAERFLQQATVMGPRWMVPVGSARYAIGAPRSSLPARGTYVPRYGYQLASMPFAGESTPSVFAHVTDGRIDRFTLFIGAAGD